MSLQAPKTITEVFHANGITTPFVCTLLQCQELALAVNLKGKYAVLFETTQHGIFCETWLAKHSAQHKSHCRFECFYGNKDALKQMCHISEQLLALLALSAGGEQ